MISGEKYTPSICITVYLIHHYKLWFDLTLVKCDEKKKSVKNKQNVIIKFYSDAEYN